MRSARRLLHPAPPLRRPGRHHRRQPGRRPDAGRARRDLRLVRERAAAARLARRRSVVPRAARSRAGDRARRARPPGPPVRAAGRGARPPARPRPVAGVPGDVRAARSRDGRAPRRQARPHRAARAGRAARSDAVGPRGRARARVALHADLQPRSVRRRDHPADGVALHPAGGRGDRRSAAAGRRAGDARLGGARPDRAALERRGRRGGPGPAGPRDDPPARHAAARRARGDRPGRRRRADRDLRRAGRRGRAAGAPAAPARGGRPRRRGGVPGPLARAL